MSLSVESHALLSIDEIRFLFIQHAVRQIPEQVYRESFREIKDLEEDIEEHKAINDDSVTIRLMSHQERIAMLDGWREIQKEWGYLLKDMRTKDTFKQMFYLRERGYKDNLICITVDDIIDLFEIDKNNSGEMARMFDFWDEKTVFHPNEEWNMQKLEEVFTLFNIDKSDENAVTECKEMAYKKNILQPDIIKETIKKVDLDTLRLAWIELSEIIERFVLDEQKKEVMLTYHKEIEFHYTTLVRYVPVKSEYYKHGRYTF